MSVFQEIGLKWNGEEYVVPPDRVMGLIETVEEVITLAELGSNRPQPAKTSRAFAMALTYAGAKEVTPEAVYTAFFDTGKAAETLSIVTSLLMMMIPPEHLQEKKPKAATKKLGKKTKAGKGSSAKPSKPQ